MYYDRIAYIYKNINRLDENLDRIQKNIALLTAIHVSNTNMDKFDKEYNRNLEKIMCKLQKVGNYFNNIEQHCWHGHAGPTGPQGPRGPQGPINDPQKDNVLYVDDNTVINKKKEEPRKSDDEIKKELDDLLKIIQNKRSEL